MINLEIPKKFKPLAQQANQVATEVFRPISRKYDEAEHSYPKELDMLASLIDGMNEGSDIGGAGAAGVRRESNGDKDAGNRNGSNLSTVLGIIELCWGDVGLLLSMPRQGLGNSAIASVASDEQLERYGGKWAAMAVGVARASLEETRKRLEEAGVEIDYDTPALSQSAAAARYLEMESDYEAALLLTLQAAWMADNGKPNSLQASMAKAKAGRTCVDVALGCVELCGSVGYGENELLEKWAQDAKILDIFEETQQIQLLIVARQLLGKSLSELR